MHKVCKVVFNSVSHDARVLKEAKAVKESGFDVTIIGIQDANNNTPIEITENGIVIRRAAWISRANKPLWLIYTIGVMITISVGAIMSAYGSRMLLFARSTFDKLNPYSIYLVILSTVAFIICFLLFRKYKLNLERYNRIKTNERNLSLKFDSIFEAHKASTGGNFRSRTPKKKVYSFSSCVCWRPLMGGAFSLLNHSTRRKWRAVFARESSVYKILKDENPKIVHAHDLTALPVCSRYKSKYKSKLIFDAHEIYDHLAQASDIIAANNSKVLSKYSRHVDHFITINRSISNYYRKFYRRLPPALIIKNATLPTPKFKYDGRLHNAAGLNPDKKILIYQGGFAPNRGLINLVLSSEFLNDEWAIIFMGWGKLEDELKRVAKSLFLKKPTTVDCIKFLPKVNQNELPYWTAGATVGIIPYENTGLNHWYCNPNKLWEYPNANVPILVSPFPELRSYIEKHSIGWLLDDPITPQNIAEVVNSLSDQEINLASSRCKHFIEKDNWNVYSQVIKDLYKKI